MKSLYFQPHNLCQTGSNCIHRKPHQCALHFNEQITRTHHFCLVQSSVRAWLNCNVYLHEAKRLCLNRCSWLLNDVECETFNLFVTQISRNFLVISFQYMFHKTLRYRLAKPLVQFQFRLFYCGKDCQSFASNVTLYLCESSRQNHLSLTTE